MLSKSDEENLVKAAQCANLLSQDLKELTKTSNPLLGEIVLSLLAEAVAIEQKLQRLVTVTKS